MYRGTAFLTRFVEYPPDEELLLEMVLIFFKQVLPIKHDKLPQYCRFKITKNKANFIASTYFNGITAFG